MPPSIPTEFTPYASLFGGILIGLSAVMVMALFGRIAGISGITSGALSVLGSARLADWDWRAAFIGGLIASPIVAMMFGVNIGQTVSSNIPAMVIAGLLVGVGTRLGAGCTSGHGVCGLARLSWRSMVAVMCFMAFAASTVALLRHVMVA